MVVYSFVQLYYTISGEELFVFKSKKCRIYAACGVSQTPIFFSFYQNPETPTILFLFVFPVL
ncbi:MAG: hypothetical protein U0N27_06205, partial [Massilistercora timonensis]